MVEAQGSAVEAALWAALEVLEERSELLRRIAERMDDQPRTGQRFREGARDADDRARRSSAASLGRRRTAAALRLGTRMSDVDDAAFEALLEFLKRTRGVDFTGYKRASLQRRFRRRMEAVGCESFGDYLDYLEVAPGGVRAALRDAADQRHRVLPRPAGVGAPARRGAAGAAGRPRRPTSRCASGAPAARAARRPTRARWCSPSCSASTPTASA